MGGRGSAYISYKNSNSSSGVDIGLMADIIDTMEDDPDTKLPHKGYTQSLKDKHIHIKKSTDNIDEAIVVPNANKVQELTNKYTKTTKTLQKNDEQLRIRSSKLSSNVSAAFISSQTEFKNLQVVYNQDIQFMNKERLERQTQKQIDSGFWTKSDNEDLVNHTITHEYGHYVQRILMERDITQHNEDKARRNELIEDIKKSKSTSNTQKLIQEYSEEYATKYIKSVQKICRKNFGRDYETKILSRYGTESNREYFAEIFCNAETNTNPDDIGKAMQIFLNKKLK